MEVEVDNDDESGLKERELEGGHAKLLAKAKLALINIRCPGHVTFRCDRGDRLPDARKAQHNSYPGLLRRRTKVDTRKLFLFRTSHPNTTTRTTKLSDFLP